MDTGENTAREGNETKRSEGNEKQKRKTDASTSPPNQTLISFPAIPAPPLGGDSDSIVASSSSSSTSSFPTPRTEDSWKPAPIPVNDFLLRSSAEDVPAAERREAIEWDEESGSGDREEEEEEEVEGGTMLVAGGGGDECFGERAGEETDVREVEDRKPGGRTGAPLEEERLLRWEGGVATDELEYPTSPLPRRWSFPPKGAREKAGGGFQFPSGGPPRFNGGGGAEDQDPGGGNLEDDEEEADAPAPKGDEAPGNQLAGGFRRGGGCWR